jgi:hypothetical protein
MGKKQGVFPVKFNEKGMPCIDKAFLENAGLFKSIKRETCPWIQQYWAGATLETQPDSEQISLVVPPEAIDLESGRQVADVRGGVVECLIIPCSAVITIIPATTPIVFSLRLNWALTPVTGLCVVRKWSVMAAIKNSVLTRYTHTPREPLPIMG